MIIYTECNIWHDDGDDGVTGWQPIGEPLIRRTSNEGTIIETDGGDITAERI